MDTIQLPDAPAECSGPVKAWSEPVVIRTYEPMAPDKNPMFLENRVYQGSSGRVYPLPFIDRIASEATAREWQAVHLENEFIRLMILPEIGGRIHIGFDKINGYDFFYRQNVIKPALVGLAGPWISGGVEFNWPQHHRPATFMPVNTEIEREEDGSVTIWCSDHDPMDRMRGTHGLCLHPGRALVELKVRLFNRTPLTRTFLWWANVGVHVDEDYESIFPPDVHFVADHARRAVTSFPLCKGSYYGVDYGSRELNGIPAEQIPSRFLQRGDYATNDLSRYANIPVPTSYMALNSHYDFLAGYDHGRKAGVVHIADHHIAPGKKQWTWGNHEFGYAWDRNLTDTDGPYIELMAGVYTDNQPDFSFLTPFETKTFSQYWLPIRDLGRVQQANENAAVSVTRNAEEVTLSICVSRSYPDARITLSGSEWVAELTPDRTYKQTVPVPFEDITLILRSCDGSEIIRWEAISKAEVEAPALATEPPMPERIKSQDELYLTGVHLHQYRHATRKPEFYWQEALRRDPTDSRCNTAMGDFYLRRGELENAVEHFRAAVKTLTRRNNNPECGEPFYLLGVSLRYLGDLEGAYAAFYKATWNQAWTAAGYLSVAEIDALNKSWVKALAHVSQSLRYNSDNLNARNLQALILRTLGRDKEADEVLEQSWKLDRLDPWTQHLRRLIAIFPNQQLLDVAFDYARSGFFAEAVEVLRGANLSVQDGSLPMVEFAIAFFLKKAGDHEGASELEKNLNLSPMPYCFPSRVEEQMILVDRIRADPKDAAACYYLGNLFYDKRRYHEAIDCWVKSSALDPDFPTVWRNLGIAYFNVIHDETKAVDAFERAFSADHSDARIVFERDQLWKRIGRPLEERLRELERLLPLVIRRDDLSVELATLYNQTGRPAKALELLRSRSFQPWEGGEGLALAQYVRACIALGREKIAENRPEEAIRDIAGALAIPLNLNEAKHVLANQNNIRYWLGVACASAGRESEAHGWWHKAIENLGDFQQMGVKPFSEMTIYTALSLACLGETAKSLELARGLESYARQLSRKEATVDYFATSLPSMLLFNDDLKKRQRTIASVLQAQADVAKGRCVKAGRTLRKILVDDPSHEVAFDMLKELPLVADQSIGSEITVNV